jgi:predicted peptidase
MMAYRYIVVLPEKFEPAVKHPLILFLHGASERGDDLELVKKHGPFQMLKELKTDVILVAPQCPANQEWWDADALARLLDQVEKSYCVDENRVYLTGMSMGGDGVWSLATLQPERFAAIAPISGTGDIRDASRLTNVRVWAFHGAHDTVFPAGEAERMVTAIQVAGGRAKFTMYAGVGHDAWTRTYNSRDFYQWLFAQKRQ